LRSASRNSATVFASTPARLAPRAAVRDVVFAALRAFCWRARACPPFLAAALRFGDDDEDDRELADDERPRALDEERLLLADGLLLLAEDRLLLAVERLLLAEERLRLDDERLPDPDLLPDVRLLEERLDPLDFDLPPEPPLLRRSAMCRSPSWCSGFGLTLTPGAGLSHLEAGNDGRVV
jgi:hypothetical protein